MLNGTARPHADLVEGEETVIDVPFPHVDPTMRCICNTVDTGFDFPRALILGALPDGFDDFFDGYDRSEDIGASGECHDSCAGGY